MVPRPDDDPVTLRDAETARRIARAALKGGAAEKRPTREQLLSAFDETDASAAATRRVEAALRMAGVSIPEGGLDAAAPGERVALEVTPVEPGSRGAVVKRAAFGAGALAALIAAVAVASSALKEDDGGERVGDVLPAAATASPEPGNSEISPGGGEAPTGATGPTGPADAVTGPTGPSPAELEAEAARERAADRKKARERKRAADRRAARRKREARRRAAARRLVTVRLTPAAATFLCVDDGAGKVLFNGTLSSRRTFKGKRVRLNVGLASTRVTINGRPYQLSGSPSGVDITRRATRFLPLGSRPAC